MIAYHAVTERPMREGQTIVFDENRRSGVYRRVKDKLQIVSEIYADPEKYKGVPLEHHTAVALRELAMEEVRREKYPQYPSRMGCLYVSQTLNEAVQWGEFFARIGRPTYSIVELDITGNVFIGEATRCFDGTSDKSENMRLAQHYWNIDQAPDSPREVREILAGGEINVLRIVKEINANIG